MAIVMLYEWLHVFGYRKKRHTAFAVLSLGIFILYIHYVAKPQYVGKDNETIRKSITAWTSAVLFAVVAASFVHTYFMQPFVIPTSSLEKTLLVGDFLFVSKFHYGVRTPMTPISMPMVHDSIPVIGTKSYLNKPQLPYFRLPALQKIKRNDIVVFNWPTDTVRFFRDQSNIHIDKPIDKKSNYVKRGVGIPGDSLEIRNGYIYINGQQTTLPDRAKPQYSYIVQTKGVQLPADYMYERFDVTDGFGQVQPNVYIFSSLTEEVANTLKNNPNIASVERRIEPKGNYNPTIFPHSAQMPWNEDNYGPIFIPKAGASTPLSITNLPLYRRIIETYEGNKLELKDGTIYINDKAATSYTFKKDYYWMMGDNRHNSEDSRYWGFVPFDHVVGKPVFIWMSVDQNASGFNKIRWKRLFTTVGGQGEPVSYFTYFLIALGLWFGYSTFIRKKKNK